MRKQRKKIRIMLAAATVALAMVAGCGQNKSVSVSGIEQGRSDLEYVQSKGTLVVGITDYAPMDYREGRIGQVSMLSWQKRLQKASGLQWNWWKLIGIKKLSFSQMETSTVSGME